MSIYACINKDFKNFIEGIDINSFSNEILKFMKNITIQSIIIFISDIKNLQFLKKYFNDDKLKNIEPHYLHYLAIIIMEQLNIKDKEVIEHKKKSKRNEDSANLSTRKYANKKLFSEAIFNQNKEEKLNESESINYSVKKICPEENTLNLSSQKIKKVKKVKKVKKIRGPYKKKSIPILSYNNKDKCISSSLFSEKNVRNNTHNDLLFTFDELCNDKYF